MRNLNISTGENMNVKYEKKRGKMKTIIVLRKTLLKI
jgi:hypothetical protein